jgi:glyoxylase-like metal-dependent hydrolase (beta-lactamase superfamily II)
VKTLATGVDYADLQFRERPGIVAAVVLHGTAGVAILDPGPSSCLPTLRRALATRGIGVQDIRSIVLTHIHLDHAGATGTIVAENPSIAVFVHERGAKHLIDPSKLLDSATRLYGDRMDRLWGEVRGVPAANVRALAGGEQIQAGGRTLDVAYGIAFVGDTAGIRREGGRMVVPPTPPPDIDPDLWATSVARIDEWRPETLFITHFGAFGDVTTHLQELLEQLRENSALVRKLLEAPGTDEERTVAFSDHLRRALRSRMTDAEAERYEVAGGFQYNWQGLSRYWRKRLALA